MITRRNLLKCSPGVLLGEKPKDGILISGVGITGYINEDGDPDYSTDRHSLTEFSNDDFNMAVHKMWGDSFNHQFEYFIHKDGIDIRIKDKEQASHEET